MSRIYEALQQSNSDHGEPIPVNPGSSSALSELLAPNGAGVLSLDGVSSFAMSEAPDRRLVAKGDNRSLGAEKLRILSARLRYTQQQRPSFKKLLITSAVRGEGKSLVSANLGITFALQRQRTLLIDGDLHRPSLSTLLGTGERRGLSDWWQQQEDITRFLCRVEGLPLWLLPAGSLLDQPLTMLQSPEISQLIGRMSAWFDWIVIDSSPCAPLADSATWATMVDGLLMVARRGRTPKKLLEKALESLEKSKVLGIVLNDATTDEQRYYRDYYQTMLKKSAGSKDSGRTKALAVTTKRPAATK
jgi:capsular exopolysaccharide synthesis family protein